MEEAEIYMVTNCSDAVKKEQFKSFEKKSPSYSSDEAVQRALERLNENCYHALYNNSHHFVTLAKTGRENPLTEIIESLTHHRGMFIAVLFFLASNV